MESWDCRVLDASVRFVHQPFRVPLRLSTGAIAEITEARAEVRVQIAGREAAGQGSIYLSDLWAWPDPQLDHTERDRVLRRFCEELAGDLPRHTGEPAHPLELGLRLHHAALHRACIPNPTALARSMCASPFDAALHDAAGQALGCSAFAFYDTPFSSPSADPLWSPAAAAQAGSAATAIRRLLRPEPKRALAAWIIVGPHDSFDRDVAPWIRERGYHCFKLKVAARDPEEDAHFAARVYRETHRLGARNIRLCADPNGAYPGPEAAVRFLDTLQATDPDAYAAFEYIEQPAGREVTVRPHDWRAVAQRRPVLLDEGLTDLDILPLAREQGWSGFALKTCKGHSFALVAAAWAATHGRAIALQDLTNPGLSFIHAALFAAFVPTLNDVELNSPQFTPAANAGWVSHLPQLFEPRDGRHRLPKVLPPGLGSVGLRPDRDDG